MKCDRQTMRLYAVTDRSWLGEKTLVQQVEEALKGGITCLQLREKDMTEEEFLAEALEIRDLCRKYRVPFIVNDNVEVAVRCQADGVHIGQDDQNAKEVRAMIGPDRILGVSARTVAQARQAVADGADYLGVGAVFPTTTKLDARDVTREEMQAIRAAVPVPIVAIGGIKPQNIGELAGSGADGIAVVSAIFAAENIEERCRELRRLSEEMVKSGGR